MTSNEQRFADAVTAATCNFFSATGSAALSYATWGLFTPGPFDEWAALGYGLLANAAYSTGCSWDDTQAPTFTSFQQGCVSTSSGTFQIWANTHLGTQVGVYTDVVSYSVNLVPDTDKPGVNGIYVTVNKADGSVIGPDHYLADDDTFTSLYSVLDAGAVCDQPAPYSPPPPITYTDPDNGCEITVTFMGQMADASNYGQVWLLEPKTTGRTSGGIIGGCNFSPVIYYGPPGGGGGGGTYIPYNPGPDGPDGSPWWKVALEGALGGVVGAAVKALLDEVLQGSVGGKVYRITSVCETDSQGEPISQSVEVVIPSLPWDEAVIYRLDALEHIMQGLKDFKQPICSRSKPVGDFVTVHFESDAPSIAGERPLRKYLRYRDQMASDLAAHAAHWENFAWEAGPVIVIHKNAPWGIVKVWAADADEGKRVIRHAGTISGINVDAEGEWLITSSDDPRYGRTGTMRLGRRKSAQGMVLTISKRGGPDGLPIVPVDPFP